MTRNGRAGFGRMMLAFGLGTLLALAGCDKGPDRAKVAEELKASVEAQLKDIEANTKVLTHTAVTVTSEDDERYLVVIDGLKAQPEPDGYLEIGTISYRFKPEDEKSYEVSDLKLSETMPFKGPDGKERGKLVVTTKSFSGIWSKELSTFSKLDTEFANVAATDDKGGDVRVAGLKFNSEVVDKGGGLSDSVATMILSGFAAKDTTDGDLTAGEVTIDGKYNAMKIAEFQAAARKYQELTMKQMAAMEAYAAAQQNAASGGTTTSDPAPQPSVEDQKAVTDAVMAMAAAVKGGDFKIALKDIKYTEAGDAPFSLSSLTIGSTIDGINEEKATLTFDIGHDGLALVGPMVASPVAQATLPKTGNLGLKITNVPSKDLVKVLADNMPGMMSSDPSMAEANAMAMAVAMQAVLQTSGAKIEVTPSQLLSQVIEMKTDGAFDVTPQSMFGVIGGLNVAIRGLDDLLALAQQTPDDFDAQQAQGVIGVLQQYTAREQGADGKPVDKFRIEVGGDGQMLVNGKPM